MAKREIQYYYYVDCAVCGCVLKMAAIKYSQLRFE